MYKYYTNPQQEGLLICPSLFDFSTLLSSTTTMAIGWMQAIHVDTPGNKKNILILIFFSVRQIMTGDFYKEIKVLLIDYTI